MVLNVAHLDMRHEGSREGPELVRSAGGAHDESIYAQSARRSAAAIKLPVCHIEIAMELAALVFVQLILSTARVALQLP
jgi:hypothetical protein